MSTEKRFPLEGIKVADFSWVAAGPFSTGYLADYGAEVIRIESGKSPDMYRMGETREGHPNINKAFLFGMINCNKRSLQIDMKNPKAMEVLRPLLEWADVVTENFRPGTMEKFGLDYENLKKINPKIIMVRSCVQGQTGPRGHISGFGLHLNALGGFTNATGWPDRVGVPPHMAYTDCIAPLIASSAIIGAIMYRERTGKGQYIDLSQMEASMNFMSVPLLDFQANGHDIERCGNAEPDVAPHAAYECAGDDRWCAVCATNEDEWKAFCDVIGNPEWVKDPKFTTMADRKANEEELNALITEWTKQQDARDVMNRMQAAGVPAGVVANGRDIIEDPQNVDRDFFCKIINGEENDAIRVRPAFRLSNTDIKHEPAPCIGEANEYVCREIVGMSKEHFEELKAEGLFV